MQVRRVFPAGVRAWRWWCDVGPKNRCGGTVGGSFLMRRVRDFYRALKGSGDLEGYLDLEGHGRLFVDLFDLHTFQMVVPQLERCDAEVRLAQWLTPLDGVFVDVGANIGVLSLLALSDSIGSVHSFEPNAAMMARLELTRKQHQRANRWHLYQSAVGAEPGALHLYVNQSFSGTSSLHSSWQGGGGVAVEVPVTTLDAWAAAEQVASVDVLKMDVEGWEASVLDGASETLRVHRPFVWFEHNLPVMERCGLDAAGVLDRLAAQGYEAFFDIGALPDALQWSREDLDGLTTRRVNLLAVPNERLADFRERVVPAFRARAEQGGG